jgi:hypothetical protein
LEVETMDAMIEERFVRAFINKQFQDRLLFELASKKNRVKAISRFAHNAATILNDKYIIKRGCFEDANFEKEIATLINVNNDCYIISDNDLDGKLVNFKAAFQKCMDYPMALVIICGENVAIVKEELTIGAPEKFLLYRP